VKANATKCINIPFTSLLNIFCTVKYYLIHHSCQ